MTEENTIPSDKKLCECGCGELIPLVSKHDGKPRRFQNGHNQRGDRSYRWNGGRYERPDGYIMIFMPKHPKANSKGYVYEHVMVMEEILGRRLLSNEHVHHVNGNRQDNRKENLTNLIDSEHIKHHHPPIDMSTRVCMDCKSSETWRRVWGRVVLDDGSVLYRCRKCLRRKMHY